ncbi:hypothetical protein BU23DRAFT_184531 [Bimuria novae-zelandiae CBS 107.79]|uniref:Uncharacterized protein n=1 Tax=Bimuria novae-zelandiae CBS 107.79 TaxID=1447943 RepID=A0A6A5V3C3_9PLEO|nr:hypothetical protein BU23DRAFT_184531 [Bimuria novae-zelandiae CBS 107.79]
MGKKRYKYVWQCSGCGYPSIVFQCRTCPTCTHTRCHVCVVTKVSIRQDLDLIPRRQPLALVWSSLFILAGARELTLILLCIVQLCPQCFVSQSQFPMNMIPLIFYCDC